MKRQPVKDVGRRLLDRVRGSFGFENGLTPVGTSVVLIAPVLGAALFYVWTHVTTVQLGYTLSQAADTHRGLLETNRSLRVEVAALRAPERLKELGRSRFKLAAPDTQQILRLDERASR